MIWHAFPLERAHSPEYFELDDAIVGRHQRLLWACASANEGRGNSGVWRDSSSWDDRKWVRYTGLAKDQVDELVGKNLARWVTREVADQLVALLTPTEEQTHEDGWDWERCRITGEVLDLVERRTLAIRIDTPSRSGSTDRSTAFSGSTHLGDPDRHASSIRIDGSQQAVDLVVFDFDLGGQVKSQITSETKRKAADSRWNKVRQLELRLGRGGVARSVDPIARSVDPGSTHLVDPDQTVMRSVDPDARAMHSHSNSTKRSPPYPPPGGRAPVVVPSPEETAQLERFWTWLLAARSPLLNSALWGGGKQLCFKTLCSKASERGMPLTELLEEVSSDLDRKLRDSKWVEDWADSGRGFRAYVRDDDWQHHLPPPPDPQPTGPDPAALERAAAAAAAAARAAELELREVWQDEMPGRPFPSDVDEARRALRERWHRGEEPS